MLRHSCASRPLFVFLIVTLTIFSAGAQSSAGSQPAKSAASAVAAQSSSANPSGAAVANTPQPLLPETFDGWQITGTPPQSANPSDADASDAVPLQEYGFKRYETANYTRDDGTLAVKAMEFEDATGAYGAFTFYRRSTMSEAQIGAGAAFDGARVLFWNGAVLVDARFSRITPMSAAELRDLATQLPKVAGAQGTPPNLPNYLPAPHLEPMTVQYAIGPQAYRMSGGVLPSALVDFDRSAEVVTAQYNALGGTGTLTVINYPDSDIAVEQERAIQAYFSSHGSRQNPWTPALTDSNPAAIQTRRSGPLVIVTSGSLSGGAAQELLQRVHYEVSVTLSNRAQHFSDPKMVAQIILDVAFLVGIFALIAIVLGVSLGAGRVALQRKRNKSGLPEDDSSEFIRLNLKS